MLTGDAGESALHVANAVGISNVKYRLLPMDKLTWVQERSRKHNEKVMMIGDGINDSAALAACHVGIAFGAGCSAMASVASHIVMTNDDLLKVVSTIILCRTLRRIIIWNISFSVLLKVIAIVLAIMGKLQLWEAVLVDMVAILFVMGNSMTPAIFSHRVWGREEEQHALVSANVSDTTNILSCGTQV